MTDELRILNFNALKKECQVQEENQIGNKNNYGRKI